MHVQTLQTGRGEPDSNAPLTRNQVRGFWASWGGWTLDGMDSVIYALVLVPSLRELLPRSGIAATSCAAARSSRWSLAYGYGDAQGTAQVLIKHGQRLREDAERAVERFHKLREMADRAKLSGDDHKARAEAARSRQDKR